MIERSEGNTRIPMEKLEEVYHSMLQCEGQMFINQFESILQEAVKRKGPTEFASNPELKKKNRYKNILPFDSSRVAIRNNETSYINACTVDGFRKTKKFIATQGPLSSTVTDFWLMVVEQKCAVIVMLAKCFEAGKKKCEKYWPDSGKSIQFGPVTITNEQEIRFCGFLKRRFSVTASLQDEEVKMTVYQYHFTTWPDHGVPTTTTKLIRMYDEAMQTHRTEAEHAPVIVHCSAGAGRTGTFIAYDILLEESRKQKSVDPCNCVLKMREQRVDMVQTCSQYILVHKMILESFIFANTDLTTTEAKERFTDLDYRVKVAAQQFQNLSRVEPIRVLSKDKSESLSPYDRMKVTVTTDEYESHVIDASFLESYDESTRMIAAAGPTSENVGLFWKMILDRNVSVLVTLTSEEESECWPTNSIRHLTFGEIKVKLECEESTANFDKTIITVEDSDRFVLVTWFHDRKIDESRPLDGKLIINLADEMQRILRESPIPVAVVHCRTGLENTGVFCAVVNLIARLNLEHRVDVFRAVKDLRDCRRGMVNTLERYMVCHEAVIYYMESLEVYANFG